MVVIKKKFSVQLQLQFFFFKAFKGNIFVYGLVKNQN